MKQNNRTKKLLSSVVLSIILCTNILAQGLPYLGQDPPGMIPVRFPPDDLLANNVWFWHGSPVFTLDALQMYWSIIYHPIENHQPIEIMWVESIDSSWTLPQLPNFAHQDYEEMNPYLSATSDTLYFISSRSGGGIFRTIRSGNGWSSPTALDIPLPTGKSFGNQFSVTRDGTIYVDIQENDNIDIYYTRMINGAYQIPIRLPNQINSENYDYMPFVDLDEKYLIFKSSREEGTGLYISFNDSDVWSQAMNMGPLINQNSYGALWPYVTLDGEYFFFCLSGSNGFNPYWVSTEIIDSIYSVVSVIDKLESLLSNFQLYQNYPNPFNPNTKIKYQVPELSFVTITIFDVLGNEISTLVDEEKQAGTYEVEFNANEFTSGIYFYQMTAGNYNETKKMLLLK